MEVAISESDIAEERRQDRESLFRFWILAVHPAEARKHARRTTVPIITENLKVDIIRSNRKFGIFSTQWPTNTNLELSLQILRVYHVFDFTISEGRCKAITSVTLWTSFDSSGAPIEIIGFNKIKKRGFSQSRIGGKWRVWWVGTYTTVVRYESKGRAPK